MLSMLFLSDAIKEYKVKCVFYCKIIKYCITFNTSIMDFVICKLASRTLQEINSPDQSLKTPHNVIGSTEFPKMKAASHHLKVARSQK